MSEPWQQYRGLVRPRHATPRDPSRPTFGGHVAATAAAMGWPLLPWQRYVADVAGEIEPDTGTFFYSRILVTVQRQAGKTTLDVAESVQNCLMGPNRRAWYTAQTGQHASAKWRDQVDNYFLKSALLAPLATPSYSNGAQSLGFFNGSTFNPHPPTADSLHSKQSDRNTIDEAWAFPVVKGQALEGAITPTTTTRRKLMHHRPQLWIMSTEGTGESTYFNPQLDAARAGDLNERTAFFDWGIPLDTAPPNLERPDEVRAYLATVAAHHPGYGHLFELDDLETWLYDLGVSEFARAYGNKRTGATERVIPAADWSAAATSEKIPDGAPVCFGAAVGVDGMDTAITATAVLGAGVKVTEVIEHRPGIAWAPARMRELSAAWSAPFVVDRFGPSADLADRADRAGVELLDVRVAQMAAAASELYAGVVHRGPDGGRLPPVWLHRPHPSLDEAAELAAKRSIGDGAWTWGRRASAGSIACLEAATGSTWGASHLPAKVGLQVF